MYIYIYIYLENHHTNVITKTKLTIKKCTTYTSIRRLNSTLQLLADFESARGGIY